MLLTKPEHDPASNGSSSSPGGGQPPGSNPPVAEGGQDAPAVQPAQRACPKCGSPMRDGQDWCLQCGAGAPSSVGNGPGWRTGVAILAATALLLGGASVAAYAALEKSPNKKTAIVAVKTTTTTPAGATTAPGTATTPGATSTPSIPTPATGTPPKIPLQTPTPQSSGGEGNEANNTLFPPETGKATKTPTKTTESSKSTNESSGSETKTSPQEAPSPILLDTDAASTYNPYAYPASLFGEPSLAIDGEESTAWTAQVNSASAPKMAEGLVLDLKTAQKLASVKVKTTTTGMSVEMRGSNSHTLPASINDPGWTQLSAVKVLKKKSSLIKLKTGGKAYRLILLWISKAPSSSTPANPGQVAVNELELFPASLSG